MASKKQIVAAIKAGNKALCAAVGEADGKAARACYTTKAKLITPGAPTYSGNKIATFWNGAIAMGIKSVSLRTVEVDVQGNTAIEYGAYTLKGARGKKLDNGSYVVVWKKERGQWRLHWDIFNTNNPA
ncbi:MAG: nuclear transport factor 2 family protein [Pseudomonadota bacterium]